MLLIDAAAANTIGRSAASSSLAVTFGAAFLIKFVILLELSTPGTGWTKRVLQTMLEGITLGTLTQDVLHPATGYIALFALGVLPRPRAHFFRKTRPPPTTVAHSKTFSARPAACEIRTPCS